MSFLSPKSGSNSSTRLLMLAWGFSILLIWIIFCFVEGKLLDIPVGVGAILGYIMMGKAIQSFPENKVNKTKELE